MLSKEFLKLNEGIVDAGKLIMKYFGKQLSLDYKSTKADYRTKADLVAEAEIIRTIEHIFPLYNILSEERGNIDKGSNYRFIVDPLDGTNNFVLGIPVFSCSVALMHNVEIVYGVIHCPVTGDIYYAAKGKGAFLNGEKIKVNGESNINSATVSYYCNYITPKERINFVKTKLFEMDVKRCLDLWSPALCYCRLASGRIEAIINDGIELYDFAAGKLLASEAGAAITDFHGRRIINDSVDKFIISNGSGLHAELLDMVF